MQNYRVTLPTADALPPIQYVQVQTHSRCNADCWYCPYSESAHAAAPGVMTDATWARVLACLAPFRDGINGGKFCPYLMQEPLLDKTVFRKIADVYAAFPGTCVEVSTNGSALTEAVVDKLVAALVGRRHEVWVSHHGVDAATFRRVMKLDHDKAVANVVRLLKASAGRLKIRVRGAGESLDGRHTVFTADQYRAYWAKLLADHGLDPAHVDVDAFRFHDRAGTLHRRDRDAYKLNVGKVREIGPGHPAFGCWRVDRWVHVLWDGTLRLCCMDYHGEVALPNLNDVTLVDYFRSDAYRAIAEQVCGARASAPAFICKRCISPGG